MEQPCKELPFFFFSKGSEEWKVREPVCHNGFLALPYVPAIGAKGEYNRCVLDKI